MHSEATRRNVMLLFSSSLVCTVFADVYLHNPRGSNDRLDESSRERSNANRLFDSQNNDRGGYNVGNLYYYAGSRLPIEWTNQHSCSNPNANCQLIIQYMCGDNVRDGATTTTIPDNPSQCNNKDCNTDGRYGMNENYTYYRDCKLRQRNQGLFTADQSLNDNPQPTARFTRQNPAGTRRGYECPEERDYYPYWQPTPWVDIAVLTNNASSCPYYQSESQNVKPRWVCILPSAAIVAGATNGKIMIPNNQADCNAFRYPANKASGAQAAWQQIPAFGFPPPDCRETQFTRDNHLGNGIGGNPVVYNWTIPGQILSEHCVLRLRYNISTGEYNGWNSSVNASLNAPQGGSGSLVDLSSQEGLGSSAIATQRGYTLKNNPQVQIFPNATAFTLSLAINTAQYGRTFQDRSFVFAIRPLPAGVSNTSAIYNLNVRGKRGNIVQVYPAVEYDFVPNTLALQKNDYIHIQWTGSDTNPNNNVGQGRAQTDRSNIVALGTPVYPQALGTGIYASGQLSRNYPAQLTNSSFIGLNITDRKNMAFLGPDGRAGPLLDGVGPYYDLGLRQATQQGTYNYMCTRNNNFSNRDQKGKIIVSGSVPQVAAIGANGGTLASVSSAVTVVVKPGTFNKLQTLSVGEIPITAADSSLTTSVTAGSGYASNFVTINSEALAAGASNTSAPITVNMKVSSAPGGVQIYRAVVSSPGGSTTWEPVDAVISNGVATFQATANGVYVARENDFGGATAGIVIAVLAVVAAVIVVAIVCVKRKAGK